MVNALGDDRADKKNMYVPYRQSKLTRLLQVCVLLKAFCCCEGISGRGNETLPEHISDKRYSSVLTMFLMDKCFKYQGLGSPV